MLHTDAERLLVLDMLGRADEEASSAYVDDLKMRFSSPWALSLGSRALGEGASHLGIVYECGDSGKTTVSLDGVPQSVRELAPLHLHASMQGGTPHMIAIGDDNTFLGVPDGLPPLRANSTPHPSPAGANQATRMRILRKISQQSAIAVRVAAVQALRCPWPLLARRYYLARAESKVAYLLPFSLGVQVAGARLVNIQARWALTAITGRTTWPRAVKVPTALRQQLCADLGWECLWLSCKAGALAMFMKLHSDSDAFAHTRLCHTSYPAAGGWVAAARRLQQALKIPMWEAIAGASISSNKRALAHYRRTVILPAVRAAAGFVPSNPPLPWLWVASAAAAAHFPQSAFELWWQLRVLGKASPPKLCPWCSNAQPLTSSHLRLECCTFASLCWTRGIRPEEAFLYPASPQWFTEAILAANEILCALSSCLTASGRQL
jgi:hypothetical protein